MIGVIYPTHNRLEYVQMTLPLILQECKDVGAELLFLDDISVDGTWEWILRVCDQYQGENKILCMRKKVGNSWHQWNIGNEFFSEDVRYIANFTNENMIPLGTLERMGKTMESNPQVNGVTGRLLGHAKGSPFPKMDECRNLREVLFIGCGMIRRDMLQKHGPIRGSEKHEKRFFGFQPYQRKVAEAEHMTYYCDDSIHLIKLDSSHIYSRAYDYHNQGWCRLLNDQISIICTRK